MPAFFRWPGWGNLRFSLALGLAQSLLFAIIYGGADWIAHRHTYRVGMHLDADLAIPLVPAMAIAYLSLMPLLWMAPFVLHTRRELLAYVLALAAATVTAGFFFLALPAADAFEPPDDLLLGEFAPFYHTATTLALRHNYLPSLHVAFTTIGVLAYSTRAGLLAKLVLGVWGALIVASTLLTHQHYSLDVVGGLILGWGAVHLVYRRRVRRGDTGLAQKPPASQSRNPGQPV
jgi:membrane-associated phospholipid phosphatase